MERSFLGNTTIYLHQCRGQKFFAGKQRADALFLFYCQSRRFCIGQIVIQFIADAGHECAEFIFIQSFSGQPDAKNVAIHRIGIIGRLEP